MFLNIWWNNTFLFDVIFADNNMFVVKINVSFHVHSLSCKWSTLTYVLVTEGPRNRSAGQPLVISDVKKGSIAHRSVTQPAVITFHCLHCGIFMFKKCRYKTRVVQLWTVSCICWVCDLWPLWWQTLFDNMCTCYQIIFILVNRSTCVNNMPRIVMWQSSHNLLVLSLMF